MYDTIIIGAGPAGLTAAIYLLRANKKVLLLEKETVGGQIASSPLVENYPGIENISGSDLANNLFTQVLNLGVDFEIEEVKEITKDKKVITDSNTYETKSIIIATGSYPRRLGLPNEENLIGKGIHFCVSCDGAFYKGKTVAVIGGGNSAIGNAIALSDIAKKVYVIQNLDELTCEDTLKQKIKEKDNVEVLTSLTVKEYLCKDKLTGIKLSDDSEIKLDGIFISIGLEPSNEIFKDLIETDKYGYAVSDDGTTNKDGIFIAGDIRQKEVRQLTTATSDGTIAAIKAIKYLNK